MNEFWRPPAPDFTGQNNEARSVARPNEFWVGPFFTPSGSNQRDSICVCSSSPRGPIAVQRRHECCVDGQLHASEQGKSISNDFDSTPVSDGNSQIHVADHPVRGHTRPSFVARSVLLPTPKQNHPSQNSRNRAHCPMVATRDKWTATSAEARSKREGKLESTEQQNMEEVPPPGPLWAQIKARSASVTIGNTSRVLCLRSTREEASCCHPRTPPGS